MSKDLLKQLKRIESFDEVPDDQLQWLIAQAHCNTYQEGDTIFKVGDPIDKMYIVLKGSFVIKLEQNGEFKIIGQMEEHSISGALPYSRANLATGIGTATSEVETVELDRAHFIEMIREYHELTAALVHVMSSRIRNFTKMQQQNDKMMALGKLSAGLAHELNNPSAAVVRSAQTLRKHMKSVPENFKVVTAIQMTADQIDAINDLLLKKIEQGPRHRRLMDKASLEDDMVDWLEDHGFEDGYSLAENFVDYDFSVEDLQSVSKATESKDLVAILSWLNQVLTTEKLVTEIEHASQRINELVNSVKSYTHMDQSSERQEADIHEGIENTLTMLNHKIRKLGVQVVKNYDYDIERPCIYVSEMNQVWTNLLDNALDALEGVESPSIEIRTEQKGEYINVNIIDSGSGISAGVIDHIFDPFYTTKAVGKGTGLGLDVVHQIISQHNGSIDVDSKPGKTDFKVCIPLK